MPNTILKGEILALTLLASFLLVFSFVFAGNTDFGSYNFTRAFQLNESNGTSRFYEPVFVNVTFTGGKITNCSRIIINDSVDELPSQLIVDKMSDNYCVVMFLANATANANTTFAVRYNTTDTNKSNYTGVGYTPKLYNSSIFLFFDTGDITFNGSTPTNGQTLNALAGWTGALGSSNYTTHKSFRGTASLWLRGDDVGHQFFPTTINSSPLLVTWWFYDGGHAGTPEGHFLCGVDGDITTRIGTNVGGSGFFNYPYVLAGSSVYQSTLPRSVGWHKAKINVTQTQVSLYVDEVLMNTTQGSYNFSKFSCATASDTTANESLIDELYISNQSFSQTNYSTRFAFGQEVGTDGSIPIISTNRTNASTTQPKNSSTVQINITTTDDTAIHSCIYADNMTGTRTNKTTFTYLVGTTIDVVNNVTVTMKRGILTYEWWCNDTAGNIATPQLYNLTIQNTAPTISEAVNISPSPLIATNNARCDYSGFSDPDGATDTDQSTFAWYNSTGLRAGLTNRTIFSGNLSTSDNITCEVTPNDGTGAGAPRNSTTVTIGDSVGPTFNTPNHVSSVSVNAVINIRVNVSDAGSSINYVVLELENPNSVKANFSMTHISGLNVSGSQNLYERNFTATVTGIWYTAFYAQDSSLNANKTNDRNTSFEAVASGGASSGGVGGGGSTFIQTTVINVTTSLPVCGNAVCESNITYGGSREDALSCPSDCELKTNFFTCADASQPCLFQFTGFGGVAKTLVIVVVAGILFLGLSRSKPKRREA